MRKLRSSAVLLAALHCLVGISWPGSSEASVHSRLWLLMGTALEITIEADSSAASRGFAAAYRAAVTVDSLMSLYKPESEISRVNRDGHEHAITLSPETSEVIAAGLHYAEITGGAFDVTVKPVMDRWGFYGKAGPEPTRAERDSLLRHVGRSHVTFDPSTRSLRMNAGTALDLGGIAKGYAVDLMIEALGQEGITSALVNLGGNMRALGAPVESPHGWPVGVRDPARPDSLLLVFPLRDAAISSSGGYEKFVEVGGRIRGHIIDPRTAAPVEGVLGTTVVAPDAMTADILSTAFFVLGPEDGLALARRLSGVQALVVSRGEGGPPPVYSVLGPIWGILPIELLPSTAPSR